MEARVRTVCSGEEVSTTMVGFGVVDEEREGVPESEMGAWLNMDGVVEVSGDFLAVLEDFS